MSNQCPLSSAVNTPCLSLDLLKQEHAAMHMAEFAGGSLRRRLAPLESAIAVYTQELTTLYLVDAVRYLPSSRCTWSRRIRGKMPVADPRVGLLPALFTTSQSATSYDTGQGDKPYIVCPLCQPSRHALLVDKQLCRPWLQVYFDYATAKGPFSLLPAATQILLDRLDVTFRLRKGAEELLRREVIGLGAKRLALDPQRDGGAPVWFEVYSLGDVVVSMCRDPRRPWLPDAKASVYHDAIWRSAGRRRAGALIAQLITPYIAGPAKLSRCDVACDIAAPSFALLHDRPHARTGRVLTANAGTIDVVALNHYLGLPRSAKSLSIYDKSVCHAHKSLKKLGGDMPAHYQGSLPELIRNALRDPGLGHPLPDHLRGQTYIHRAEMRVRPGNEVGPTTGPDFIRVNPFKGLATIALPLVCDPFERWLLLRARVVGCVAVRQHIKNRFGAKILKAFNDMVRKYSALTAAAMLSPPDAFNAQAPRLGEAIDEVLAPLVNSEAYKRVHVAPMTIEPPF